jgi:hypothetical protein
MPSEQIFFTPNGFADSAALDVNRNIKVVIVGGGGSGGTSSVDESPFTPGTSAGTPAMGDVNPSDTPPNGTLAVIALDSARNIKVNIVAGITLDGSGNLKVNIAAGSITVAPVQSNTSSAPAQTVVGTSASQVLAANALRKRFMLQNVGTTRIYISLGATSPTTSAFHFALPAGGNTGDGSSPVWQDIMWTGAVQAISSAAGGLLVVTELT